MPETKSTFLENLHHAFAQTDGTYAFPNSLPGDLLKTAKREIETLHAERSVSDAWISVSEKLPPDTGTRYQVIAASKKELGGDYAGCCKRIFTQDWVVRTWPQNFVCWMVAPPHVPLPTPAPNQPTQQP